MLGRCSADARWLLGRSQITPRFRVPGSLFSVLYAPSDPSADLPNPTAPKKYKKIQENTRTYKGMQGGAKKYKKYKYKEAPEPTTLT